MKLWEMLRDGTKGDKFVCDSDQDSWNKKEYEFIATTNSLCIVRVGGRTGQAGYLLEMCSAALSAEWIKLPKPIIKVTFEAAFNAFKNGKKIKPVTESHINSYDPLRDSTFLIEDIECEWIIVED